MSTFRRRLIVQEQDKYVKFEDPEFERVCTAEWDKDGNGRLLKEEALQVVRIRNKMFNDNKIIKSADFDIFKNLTEMGGLMFRGSSVKRCKINNITFFKDVYFSLDTTELFISLNSLKKLPDTGRTNSILDGYLSRIRFNNIEYIGEHSIHSAEYIILGVDKVPELKGNCSFDCVYVKDNMVPSFKEHSEWSKFNIQPINELANQYPHHVEVWDKM